MTYSFDPSLANNSVFTLALGTVGVFAFYLSQGLHGRPCLHLARGVKPVRA